MAGELNGTDVQLAVETAEGSGTFAFIFGMTTSSFTLNNGAIDITNKSSDGWRNLLEGEGLQSVDISGEIVYVPTSNSQNQIRAIARDKSKAVRFQLARGSEVLEGNFYVTSYAETHPDNDKSTASITLQSSGLVVGL